MRGGEKYVPGKARMNEPTPQTRPSLFTDDEIAAEIAYLVRLDKRFGTHTLRVIARQKLRSVLGSRAAGGSPADPCGWSGDCPNPGAVTVRLGGLQGDVYMCTEHVASETVPVD
jgi:hypothetical protein